MITKDILGDHGSGMGLGVDGWCVKMSHSFLISAGAQAPRETCRRRVSFTFSADLSPPSAAVISTAELICRDIAVYNPLSPPPSHPVQKGDSM